MNEKKPARVLRLVRRAMRRRCYDPNDPDYHRYGAKGVTICKAWLERPSAFVEWALANGWRPGLYLDRRSNKRGYSPGNCRWVTPRESTLNRRSTIKLTYKGATKPLAIWAEELNLNYSTVLSRYRRGDAPEAVLRPVAR
jgi:hypothetical protein